MFAVFANRHSKDAHGPTKARQSANLTCFDSGSRISIQSLPLGRTVTSECPLLEKAMDGVMRTEEGQVIRTEWIRVRIRDTYGGVRTRSTVRTRPSTMQSYTSAPSLPRSRSHNRKDSTSTWGSSAPCYSKKYSPNSLARLIRERATSRSSFSGSVDSQGKTKIICGVHPQPFIDESINQLCVGLVEHV